MKKKSEQEQGMMALQETVEKTVQEVEEKAEQKTAQDAEEMSTPTICIQSVMGGSITTEEILARVRSAAPYAEEIYIKTEENRAYYTGKGIRGYVVLWE